MSPRASVACAAALLAACAGSSGEDWLIASAASPDARYVARLWCDHYCDVPGRLTLTLRPADRTVVTRPGEAPFPPKGDLPDSDFVLLLRDGNAPDFPAARLVWTGLRTLTVALPCPEADIGKPAPTRQTVRGLTVQVASSAPCRASSR